MLADGLVGPTDEGTPQGGPLSPLLSNLMLDELDKELERRGHRFVRYADDCNIYVCSRAGGRAGDGERRTLPRTALEAEGQHGKERGGRAASRASSWASASRVGADPKRCIAPQALIRFKRRVRETDAAHARREPRADRSKTCRAT